MAFTFHKASKKQSRLRMALVGPTGSGKTYTSLAVATALKPGGRVAVIDTERGSASKYSDEFPFDVLEFENFSPRNYVEAIKAAGDAGYDVLIIDSLSHAWMGEGGELEMVDKAAARTKGNSFAAWREVTPWHNKLVDSLLQCKCHVIVTMRAKTEWVLEDEKGKKIPRKIGLAAIQRDGIEYEFDVCGDLDQSHSLTISKTRCRAIDNERFLLPGENVARPLRAWLELGEAPATETKAEQPESADEGDDEEDPARMAQYTAGEFEEPPLRQVVMTAIKETGLTTEMVTDYCDGDKLEQLPLERQIRLRERIALATAVWEHALQKVVSEGMDEGDDNTWAVVDAVLNEATGGENWLTCVPSRLEGLMEE